MFHHFHEDSLYTNAQGSITKDDFYKIINFIGRKNICDADVFFEKFKENKLKENEVCLTFDDGFKSQINVALPLLEDLKIKSFFFVFTSIFEGEMYDSDEIFRHFRMNYFKDINNFYDCFYKLIDKELNDFFNKNEKKIRDRKANFPFYSIQDTKFRLVRSSLLTQDEYKKIMFLMMKEKKFNPKEIYSNLFFNNEDLKKLDKLGHLVALHSHSHPIELEKLDYAEQKNEYVKCVSVISKILNKPLNEIKWMSHPNGSYNIDTLEILKELGVELGFKQSMTAELEKGMKKINNSFLEIQRQDHANIIKIMN